MAQFNNNNNKKHVSFEDCITIRHYDYDKNEENEDKKGKDWQRTVDLTCREFHISIEKGGCGGNWNILETKLDELDEPYWLMIGQLWLRLYKDARRIEEGDTTDEDDDNKGEE
jgi:hypothetical protein